MGFLSTLATPIVLVLYLIERFLFILINWYDAYCYSPLQKFLSPLVAKVPRTVEIQGTVYTVFTANIVSWTRTALVIPVAICLKYNYTTIAFLLILFHDFLDHLDGIVAKVQKSIYGQIDDPILGGFMDAFCDKIVNVLSLWSVLMVTDFTYMDTQQTWLYVGSCSIIIAYEFVLGIVRVQDYFQAFYSRKYGDQQLSDSTNIAAVMEGKLKEKLESLGIAGLCLSQASRVPIETTSGVIGVVCLLLSIRLAHASLEHKLAARKKAEELRLKQLADEAAAEQEWKKKNLSHLVKDIYQAKGDTTNESGTEDNLSDQEKSDESEKGDRLADQPKMLEKVKSVRKKPALYRRHSYSAWSRSSKRVDKVYTIGCFDLLHEGHIRLFERLRTLGKQIIVGVHDSRSIFQLKKRVPIDDTYKRMMNVKKHADVVYCVHGTDPTPYLHCMFDPNEECTSMYVRGDDMPDFPARDLTEQLMPVQFLPYTDTVSSTKIRKEVYNASKFGPHVRHDDNFLFY